MSFQDAPIVVEYTTLPEEAWIIVDAGGEQVTAAQRRDHFKYYRSEKSARNALNYYRSAYEWREAELRPQKVTITVKRVEP